MTAAILARRSSGTSAIAVWPCCTFDGSGFSPVSHSNTVLLPDPAYPTSPIFIAMILDSQRRPLGCCIANPVVRPGNDRVRFPASEETMMPHVSTDSSRLLAIEEFVLLPDNDRKKELVRGRIIEAPPFTRLLAMSAATSHTGSVTL